MSKKNVSAFQDMGKNNIKFSNRDLVYLYQTTISLKRVGLDGVLHPDTERLRSQSFSVSAYKCLPTPLQSLVKVLVGFRHPLSQNERTDAMRQLDKRCSFAGNELIRRYQSGGRA